MKKLFLIFLTMGFSLGTYAADSLQFGGLNSNGLSKVQVYVDQDEPKPRCPCISFNVLIADRDQIGGTYIEKVLLIIKNKKESDGLSEPRIIELNEFNALFRHPSSPTKSEQVSISLDGQPKDMEFQLLAMKKQCLNPTVPECNNTIIDVEGTFTGKDVLDLPEVSANEISAVGTTE